MTTAQPEPGSAGGPTVLRILLGAQLRRLREAAGVTRGDAGYRIRASESKISRMELGRVGFKERDVSDLLELYGVAEASERETLLALARDANTPGWWNQYRDLVPTWFQPFVGLEEAASLIRTYEVQFIPGLLQTKEYARAVISLDTGATGAEIDRRASLRMARQRLLTRPDPPKLWAIIDEAALRRPIGGDDVMRAQLEALIEATKLTNVTLQVLPFTAGGHSAAGGMFTILRFPDEDVPDVVFLEQLTSALYLDKPQEVDHYGVTMERLSIEADPPTQTAETLAGILRETDKNRSDLVSGSGRTGGATGRR
jgi:transcriptional regulator with XRE-family HTH domain